MDDETLRYCVATVPFALKLFFGLYPESCRFRIYVAWSLLLTPPVQTTGDAPTWDLYSSRGDDESDARPKRQK
jgi:hypothetical protein